MDSSMESMSTPGSRASLDYSSKVGTFAVDLLGHADIVFDRLGMGKDSAQELRTFYRSLAAIEAAYSKALMKLAQNSKFTSPDVCLQNCFTMLISTIESCGTTHGQFAKQVAEFLSTDMDDLTAQLKKERSQGQNCWAESLKALDNAIIIMNKAFEKYREICDQTVPLITSLIDARKTQNPGSKIIAKLEKKITENVATVASRQVAYDAAVKTCQELHDSHVKTSNYVLANIEATDTQRIQKIQSSLRQYYQLFSARIEKFVSMPSGLKAMIDSIDASAALSQFIHRTITTSDAKFPEKPITLTPTIPSLPAIEDVMAGRLSASECGVNKPEASSNSFFPIRFSKIGTKFASNRTQATSRSLSANDDSQKAGEADPSTMLAATSNRSNANEANYSNRSVGINPLYRNANSEPMVAYSIDGSPNSTRANAVMSIIPNINSESTLDVIIPTSALSEYTLRPKLEFYRTLYEYSEDRDDVLSFEAAEYILLDEPMSDGWAKGRISERIGLFPKAYCELCHDVEVAHVTFEYVGSSNGSDNLELSMSLGDRIWVLDDSDEHWLWAADDNGMQGNFPIAYCDYQRK